MNQESVMWSSKMIWTNLRVPLNRNIFKATSSLENWLVATPYKRRSPIYQEYSWITAAIKSQNKPLKWHGRLNLGWNFTMDESLKQHIGFLRGHFPIKLHSGTKRSCSSQWTQHKRASSRVSHGKERKSNPANIPGSIPGITHGDVWQMTVLWNTWWEVLSA